MNYSQKQLEIINTTKSKVIVDSAAAAGKALENGSIIYTNKGPIKIEDSKIGDKIFGEDGKLHTIIGVFPQGKKKKYIVKLSDGTTINCCNEHLWTFQTEIQRSHKSKTWTTATLQEIIDNFKLKKPARANNNFSNKETYRNNIWLPLTQPVEFDKKVLPLDPYTLGALLGDGYLNGSGKASVFSNADQDIIERVNNGLKKIGCCLTKYREQNNKYDYTIIQQGFGKKGTFTKILEELDLDFTRSDTKFIPEIYKYSSVEDRLELIKGLIDTDGNFNKSAYDIVLKSKQLILDLQEMIESLGLTATYSEKRSICTNSASGRKDCGVVYRLRIKTSKLIPKLHYANCKEKLWKQSKVCAHRYIEEIIETNEEVEMTCIKVDNPSSLFLTNHYIVTHNTRTLTGRVSHLINDCHVEPDKIVVITFTNAAAGEMRDRIGNIPKLHISTIHAYANYLLLIKGIDTSALLEREDFDKLFMLIKQNLDCIQEVEHLIIDEAQDSTPEQFEFLLDIVHPKNWMLFADHRQSIYRWADADPQYIIDLMHDKTVTTYMLNENYRNGSNILKYAKNIIRLAGWDYLDNSIPMNEGGRVIDVEYSPLAITSALKKYGDYKNWFVLTRTNDQLDSIAYYFDKEKIPYVSFKRSQLKNNELYKLMEEDSVKLLTIHTAKGLEAENVIVIGARFFDLEEICISYVAATRAKNLLVWSRMPTKTRRRNMTHNWET